MSEPPTAADEGAGGAPEVIVADLDWRGVAVFLAGFVGLIAITSLLHNAARSVTWVGLGTLLALALDPVVSRLERLGQRRSIAVGTVLSGFVLVVVLLVAVFGPPAARQARELSEDLPEVVADLGNLPLIGGQLRDRDIADRVERFIDQLPERLSGDTTPIENAGKSLVNGALSAVATLLVTITLLLDGQRLLLRLRRLVPPGRREQADRIGSLAYRVIAQYFAGSVLVAVIAGFTVTAVGLALGVPLAPLAGAWVALFDLVPQIGGAVGGLAFVGLAFTQSATVGLVALVFFILYLQFENHILQPLVVGRSVDLSPPATMTAALVGVSAAGVVGAMVAVPLLGAAKAIYLELRPGTTKAVVGDPDAPPVDTGKAPESRRRKPLRARR